MALRHKRVRKIDEFLTLFRFSICIEYMLSICLAYLAYTQHIPNWVMVYGGPGGANPPLGLGVMLGVMLRLSFRM